LLEFLGLKNDYSKIRMEFVLRNQTTFDAQFKREFHPLKSKMFACDEEVRLPHFSGQKCTCMVNNIYPNLRRKKKRQKLLFSFRIVQLCVQK